MLFTKQIFLYFISKNRNIISNIHRFPKDFELYVCVCLYIDIYIYLYVYMCIYIHIIHSKCLTYNSFILNFYQN